METSFFVQKNIKNEAKILKEIKDLNFVQIDTIYRTQRLLFTSNKYFERKKTAGSKI